MARSGSQGRNYRKKLARKLQVQESKLAVDQSGQAISYSAMGSERNKCVEVAQALTRSAHLERVKVAYLASFQAELDRRAILLSAPGCYAMYEQCRHEAERLGVEKECYALTVEAAKRFMGRAVRTTLAASTV